MKVIKLIWYFIDDMKSTNFKPFFILVFPLLFLVSCKSSFPHSIPDGKIVYMGGYPGLGFIQPDGTQIEFLKIKERFAKPVWSDDGNFLYGLTGHGSAGAFGGYPAYWDIEDGSFATCDRDLPFFYQIQGFGNPSNPYEVIMMHVWEIVVMDLSTCEIVQTLLDYSANPGDYSIAGFSFSSSTQELVYGLVVNPSEDRKYKILRMNIKTGDEEQISEGINPVWSPDGNQIAYVGLDGLYVTQSFDANPKLLVNRSFFDPWAIGSPESNKTIPRWSPDGKWLIYHRCDNDEICMTKDADIYKIPSDGGVEKLIVSGGEYPSWGDR